MAMGRTIRAVAAAGVLLTAACDPAVDGSYHGEAQLTVHGLVCAVGEMPATEPALGIAWKRFGPGEEILAGEIGPIDLTRLPAAFSFPLYESPPASSDTLLPGPDGELRASIGIPVLYDDVDGDGAFTAGEAGLAGPDRLLGVTRGQVVMVLPGADRYQLAEASCDGDALVGFEDRPATTAVDIWPVEGAAEGPDLTAMIAPETCLSLF